MENGIENKNFIKQIKLFGLWGKHDIVWDLNEDVNILSGKNGSGKSTIIELCYKAIATVNKNSFLLKNRKGQIQELEILCSNSKIKLTDNKSGLDYSIKYEKNLPSTNLISTFDNILLHSEAIQKLSNSFIETDLDWQIYKLQKEYLDYQLNISKYIDAIVDFSDSVDKNKIQNLRAPKRAFIEMLNELFSETSKKVNQNSNEINFLLDDTKEITPYQLSSGEKQILIILLTVLVQNQKPTVLFMDEPEISLHIEWQKKLLGYMRELNPNVQIIIATHSPAIIMNGWLDKVFNIEDLIVKETSNA
jgi:predicted ATPase